MDEIYGYYASVFVTDEKEESIPSNLINPSSEDPRFLTPQTIFLAKGHAAIDTFEGDYVTGASYNDSDRYICWFGTEELEAAWEQAKSAGHKKDSPALIEAFLRFIHKDPELELVHILTWVNRSNGYPAQSYGFISHKPLQ